MITRPTGPPIPTTRTPGSAYLIDCVICRGLSSDAAQLRSRSRAFGESVVDTESGEPFRAWPAHGVHQAESLQQPDDPRRHIQLTAADAVPGAGGIVLVGVVPGLAAGQQCQWPDVRRAVAGAVGPGPDQVADGVHRPGHVVQHGYPHQARPEERRAASGGGIGIGGCVRRRRSTEGSRLMTGRGKCLIGWRDVIGWSGGWIGSRAGVGARVGRLWCVPAVCGSRSMVGCRLAGFRTWSRRGRGSGSAPRS